MTFREILAKLVDGTPGALGAAVMASDGIAVDEHIRDGVDLDLATVVVEFQRVLEQARKVSGAVYGEGHGLRELILTVDSQQLYFRQIDDEFFVVIALESTGTLGKARYLVRCLLQELQEEL